jgi:hypothetical protein
MIVCIVVVGCGIVRCGKGMTTLENLWGENFGLVMCLCTHILISISYFQLVIVILYHCQIHGDLPFSPPLPPLVDFGPLVYLTTETNLVDIILKGVLTIMMMMLLVTVIWSEIVLLRTIVWRSTRSIDYRYDKMLVIVMIDDWNGRKIQDLLTHYLSTVYIWFHI